MTSLHKWAARHHISPAALAELPAALVPDMPVAGGGGRSEAAVQARVRREASWCGARLWRNNLGATVDSRGNYLRYGLANDSPAVNKVIKSSDLIGIRPVTLPSGMVIGQFMAREIKPEGWIYTGTERERAQLKFLELVAAMGGDACFATGEGTI